MSKLWNYTVKSQYSFLRRTVHLSVLMTKRHLNNTQVSSVLLCVMKMHFVWFFTSLNTIHICAGGEKRKRTGVLDETKVTEVKQQISPNPCRLTLPFPACLKPSMRMLLNDTTNYLESGMLYKIPHPWKSCCLFLWFCLSNFLFSHSRQFYNDERWQIYT